MKKSTIGIAVLAALMSQATMATTTLSPSTSTHLITGVITNISGSILTLKTRTGVTRIIDDTVAMQTQMVQKPINVGVPVTVQGSVIEGNSALQATIISRAKADQNLWPLDR